MELKSSSQRCVKGGNNTDQTRHLDLVSILSTLCLKVVCVHVHYIHLSHNRLLLLSLTLSEISFFTSEPFNWFQCWRAGSISITVGISEQGQGNILYIEKIFGWGWQLAGSTLISAGNGSVGGGSLLLNGGIDLKISSIEHGGSVLTYLAAQANRGLEGKFQLFLATLILPKLLVHFWQLLMET